MVVSAPSGTGKTSLRARLLETMPGVAKSISYTTRTPRGAEVDGRDYHFVSPSEFQRMIDADEFIEWAEFDGHRYGTSAKAIEAQLREGHDVVLDIDVQGGEQIRSRLAGAVLIFLLPPSMEELQRRLQKRATDAPIVIERRLARARIELAESKVYDYLVVNDDLESAFEDLKSIVLAERARREKRAALAESLLRSGKL